MVLEQVLCQMSSEEVQFVITFIQVVQNDEKQFQSCVKRLLVDDLQFSGLRLDQILFQNKNDNAGKFTSAKGLLNMFVDAGSVGIVSFVVAHDVVELRVCPVVLIRSILQILLLLFNVIIWIKHGQKLLLQTKGNLALVVRCACSQGHKRIHERLTVLLVKRLAQLFYFINRGTCSKHKQYVEHFSGNLFAKNLVKMIQRLRSFSEKIPAVCAYSTLKNAQLNDFCEHILNKKSQLLRINILEPRLQKFVEYFRRGLAVGASKRFV